jgi:hypothetical protein
MLIWLIIWETFRKESIRVPWLDKRLIANV